MIYVFSLLSVALVAATSRILIRWFRPKYFSESILLFFLFSTAQISLLGYAVSYFKKLALLEYWCLAGFVLFALVFLADRLLFEKEPCLPEAKQRFASLKTFLKDNFSNLSRFDQSLLGLLFVTSFACALLNLSLVLFSAPSSYDSLAIWTARVGYFLQQGSLDYFEANQIWTAHRPKIQTILMIYAFLVSDRNENLMQIVNYVGFWVAAGSVYYLCKGLRYSVSRSLFAGLIFSLLINPLLNSTLTSNDILLPTYVGIAIGFCFSFRETQKIKYLLVAAVSIALAFNVKETFAFCVPALSIIVYYTLCAKKESVSGSPDIWRNKLKAVGIFAVYLSLATAMFALPAGYWDNYLHKGQIILVPKEQATQYLNNESGSLVKYLKNLAMNCIRFAVDFISLDGLPSQELVRRTQGFIKEGLESFFERLNLDLATHYAADHGNYIKGKEAIALYRISYWGVLGFLLIWPVLFLHIFGVFKNKSLVDKEHRLLAFAAIVFFISQALLGEYDVWRGRYFTIGAVISVPLSAAVFGLKNRWVNLFLFPIVVLGCVSAICAILMRSDGPIIGHNGQVSIFSRDRYEQLTLDSLLSPAELAKVIKKYEKLVPMNATVAQWVGTPPFEYLYFGPKLLRRVLPLKFWEDEVTRVPYNADYMVFQSTNTTPERGDVLLGMNIFLRKLHPPMRFEENLALPRNGGRAVVIYGGKLGMPASNLNDGTNKSVGTYDANDVAFAIARDNPYWARTIQVVLFEGGTLRDVSVVATDDAGLTLSQWKILRSRITGSPVFNIKTTVPPGKDKQVVMIEIDKEDPNYREYKVFGLASFSRSSPLYQQNYRPENPGVAVRELMMSQENPEHFQPMLVEREAHAIKDLYVMDYEFYQNVASAPSTEVKTFKYTLGNSVDGQLIKPEDNLALKANGGIAGVTSAQNNFSVSNLNDGGSSAWGADGAKDGEDAAFFITRREAFLPRTIQLVLFGAKGNTHMKDLSVVATDDLNKPLSEWVTLNSKIVGSSPTFQKKITVATGEEGTVVTIEIDPNDPNYRAYKALGLACFSKSAGYERNYIPQHGGGIYVHEILMSALPPKG